MSERNFGDEFKAIATDLAYNTITIETYNFRINALTKDYEAVVLKEKNNSALQDQARQSVKVIGNAELQKIINFDKTTLATNKQTEFESIQTQAQTLLTALQAL